MTALPALYEPEALVRFGTSSFSSKDWVGPFYPPGTRPAAYLSEYARHFDTVEVDATYYATPRARMVDGWAAKVPPGFLISAKFPKSIVHGGQTARPDPRRVLDPDATYEERDAFLGTMARLGPALGTLLIQFPYFNRSAFPSVGPFLERLEPFLRDLPKEGFRYALEVRNKAWVTAGLLDACRLHGISFTLVDQAWMPHGDELDGRLDVATGPETYIRLLGDRQAIERITTTWEREVLDHSERMERWAVLIAKLVRQGRRTLVYVNNHYAGHAPTTVRKLKAMIEAQR
ncbi:MAG: DUF72 domain-containing protein [Planctomycetota bacterium]|nr:DUF72 domain-containing protein [Planctomycetota bacterium]